MTPFEGQRLKLTAPGSDLLCRRQQNATIKQNPPEECPGRAFLFSGYLNRLDTRQTSAERRKDVRTTSSGRSSETKKERGPDVECPPSYSGRHGCPLNDTLLCFLYFCTIWKLKRRRIRSPQRLGDIFKLRSGEFICFHPLVKRLRRRSDLFSQPCLAFPFVCNGHFDFLCIRHQYHLCLHYRPYLSMRQGNPVYYKPFIDIIQENL